MNYYYVTGTSKGIGNSIAQILLSNSEAIVEGIGRTQTITHQNYKHHFIDLRDLTSVDNFNFRTIDENDNVYLINNAGVMSNVSQLNNLSTENIVNDYNVNLVSAAMLMNKFVKQYQHIKGRRVILNVSSGAARHPFASWSVYCSAKAGLDMISNVLNEEQKLTASANPVRVFSVAPGIVDTQMQTELRAVNREHFSKVDTFIGYKEKNLLSTPEDVARKLISIIHNPEKYSDVLLDVRNL